MNQSAESQPIDLAPFCSTDENRPSLNNAFTYDEYTYATDGRIFVRVAKRDGCPNGTDVGAPTRTIIEKAVSGPTAKPYERAEIPDELPGISYHPCEDCEASGKIQVAERRFIICDECDGCGNWKLSTGVKVGKVMFDAAYLRLIKALPGVRFFTAGKRDPAHFVFDGGEGKLMPMIMRQKPSV